LELDDSVLHELFQEQEVNVGLDALERMQQTTQVDLIKEFAQKEKNNRYLIVLEDLCTMVQWMLSGPTYRTGRKGAGLWC
jgi:hypothetical protein